MYSRLNTGTDMFQADIETLKNALRQLAVLNNEIENLQSDYSTLRMHIEEAYKVDASPSSSGGDVQEFRDKCDFLTNEYAAEIKRLQSNLSTLQAAENRSQGLFARREGLR